nr:extracellular solute-binding protein [Acetatifactor sp.]
PNYNAIPEADKEIMETAQTMADGNVYSLSSFQPEAWNFTPNRTFINKAWLDKLGLAVPTTTEELKDVLIAFRDNDPNGNGKMDEIGVYGYQGGWYGENVLATLMNSFVFWNRGGQNGGLSLAEDGSTVIAPFATEGWKKGLQYMNDLYNEGLLAPGIFIDDGSQFKATLNEEDNVVGFVSMGSVSNYPDAATNANFLEMEMIQPLTGPDGICYVPYTQYSPDQNLFIFSATKNAELAVRFADEFYDSDTSIIVRYGEEGVDWTRDPEVLSGVTNAFVEEGLYDKVSLASISNMWSENSTQTWHNCNPRYTSAEVCNTVANGMVEYNADDPTQLHGKNYAYYADKHPDKVLPLLHYTEEDSVLIQDALANIPEYVNKAMAEFITGARDIESGWDAYLDEMNSLGLEQWLTIAQKTYDESLEN